MCWHRNMAWHSEGMDAMLHCNAHIKVMVWQDLFEKRHQTNGKHSVKASLGIDLFSDP